MRRILIMAVGILMVLGVAIVTAWLSWPWQWSKPQPQALGKQSALPMSTVRPSVGFLTVDQVPAVTAMSAFASSELPGRLDPAKTLTIVTTGDIIPARGVDLQIRQHGFDYPFAGTGIDNLLRQADLTVVNLEAPLLRQCPVTKDGFTFCGQPEFAGAMARAGIDVATLENNHIGNYGQAGIDETIQLVTAAGMTYATSSHLSVQTVKGFKIGTLAFTGVGGRFYPNDIAAQIRLARPQVDLLLVAFHWGKEYELVPTPDPAIAPDDPRAIGHLAVDSGADLVIGNHPHWVQGVEVYKGKFIAYALGNFIFDQSWSPETQQGAVGRYTFYDGKLIKVEYLPVHIDHQAQPRLADSQEAAQILGRMKQSTLQISQLPPVVSH